MTVSRTRRRRWQRVPTGVQLAICKAYRRTGATGAIARRFGTNRQTLHNILRRHHVPLFSRAIPPRTVRAVVKAYRAGTSIKRLVHQFDLSRPRITKVLKAADVRLRTRAELARLHNRRLTASQEAAICELYNAGKSLHEVATRRHVNVITVRRVLRRNGVRSRSIAEGRMRRLTAAQERHICSWYEASRWSVQRVARRLKMSRGLVKAVLARNGVRIRSKRDAAINRWSRRRSPRLRARSKFGSPFSGAASAALDDLPA